MGLDGDNSIYPSWLLALLFDRPGSIFNPQVNRGPRGAEPVAGMGDEGKGGPVAAFFRVYVAHQMLRVA
jgi:hypothetical protein